jgi:hypothetical protein
MAGCFNILDRNLLSFVVKDVVSKDANFLVRPSFARFCNDPIGGGRIYLLFEGDPFLVFVAIGTKCLVQD